jgi:hypothetical protein
MRTGAAIVGHVLRPAPRETDAEAAFATSTPLEGKDLQSSPQKACILSLRAFTIVSAGRLLSKNFDAERISESRLKPQYLGYKCVVMPCNSNLSFTPRTKQLLLLT